MSFTTQSQYALAFNLNKTLAIASDLVLSSNANEAIKTLVRERKFVDLIRYDIDYSTYTDVNQLIADRQALALYQKNPDLDLGIDRSNAALGKFLEAEEVCRQVNETRLFGSKEFQKYSKDVPLDFRVARKISDILGPVPPLDEFFFGFGPGANVGISRLTSIRRKLSAVPTVTPKALKYVQYLQHAFPHWSYDRVAVTSFGKVAFVPKTALIDRSICVEPIINTFLQKGIGRWIRERLAIAGCNLNDQSRNQKLARQGSIDGSLATIDLSSASDTISYSIVMDLLPFEWFSLLDDLRTPSIKLSDDRKIDLEKFSSMGNGFTFELESLIFFAIASVTAGQKNVSVYGDDIIVPTASFETTVKALECYGFSTNEKKSYSTGLFRESCGSDWFSGTNVRPVYLKSLFSFKEVMRFHNAFMRRWYPEISETLLKYLPKKFRIFGPDGFGDGHLIWHPADAPKIERFKKSRGWDGYTFRTFTAQPYKSFRALSGDYAAFLYGNTYRPDRDSRDHTCDDDSRFSDTMYQERTSSPHYEIRRVFVLGRP